MLVLYRKTKYTDLVVAAVVSIIEFFVLLKSKI